MYTNSLYANTGTLIKREDIEREVAALESQNPTPSIYSEDEEDDMPPESPKLRFLRHVLYRLDGECLLNMDYFRREPRTCISLAIVDVEISQIIDAASEFLESVLGKAKVGEGDQEGAHPLGEEGQEPEDNEGMEVDSTKIGGFEMMERAPKDHIYYEDKWIPKKMTPHYMKAYRKELEVLRNSLPEGIFVKGYEDRIDLFSCLIIGPKNTPFADGMFLFDLNLPDTYPLEPPLAYYISYSREQLNPNLYQCGKVCVSLLGTWSGRSSEVWNPGSNLLQVFVSIQGLILNSEPYFNEAGYEGRKGAGGEWTEKSRRYNENSLLRSLENLTRMADDPPEAFRSTVDEHISRVGMKLYKEVWDWIEGEEECSFPLQPVSAGCKLAAKRQLERLKLVCSAGKSEV